MDWAASAIKPGRQSLNRTSMDGRRAQVAIFQTGTGRGQGVIRINRMRFVKLARGVTLMLGPLPRHSCHPISHSGRGASARETSGRPGPSV